MLNLLLPPTLHFMTACVTLGLHAQQNDPSLAVGKRCHCFQHLLFVIRGILFEFNGWTFPLSDGGLDLRLIPAFGEQCLLD